jgi:hypothetical protein
MYCKHMIFLTLETQAIKIIDMKFFKDDFAKQNCAAAQRTMVLFFTRGNSSYLSMVHEVEKTSHVVFVHIAQDDDGMLTGVALQERKTQDVETRQFFFGGEGFLLHHINTDNTCTPCTSVVAIRPRIEQGTCDYLAADSYDIH